MGYEGELIVGRYRLLSLIGQGAMGMVWRAWDERLERLVALKQLLQAPMTDDSASFRSLLRAMREARVTARVRHAHAITVHDVVEGDGTPYLVMEHFASRPLTELLEEHGPLAPHVAGRLGYQVASALASAHACGVLHRDVSPNNILVAADGTAKIADFGLSHAMGEGTMTGGGLVVGTPAYVSPEVADGKDADYPSDVFSLGASLYTAVEGAPPFGIGENPIALLKRIAHGEIRALRGAGPLTGVLQRLLHRDPRARPTMAEATTLLRAVVENQSLPEKSAASEARQHTARSRPRSLLLGSVAAACLIAASVLVGMTAGPRSTENSPGNTLAIPVPLPAIPAHESPAITPSVAGVQTSCAARYQVTKSWSDGFQVLVTVRNDEPTAFSGWTVRWSMPAGTRIDDLWNGMLIQSGSAVTVANAAWNATLRPHESTTFGLIALTQVEPGSLPVILCETK